MAGFGTALDRRQAKPALVPVRWVHPTKSGPDERRSHHRKLAREGVFALVRLNEAGLKGIGQMSMGDIACAVFKCGPQKMGQIRDISLGGLSFSYVDGGMCLDEDCKLDILVADSAFYLEDLPFRWVVEASVADEDDFQVVKMKTAGLQFTNLNSRQKIQLKRFLRRLQPLLISKPIFHKRAIARRRADTHTFRIRRKKPPGKEAAMAGKSILQLIEEQVQKWQLIHAERPRDRPARRCVTVSREPGSGGRLVAEGVAGKLGMDLFHQEIIHEMAQSARVKFPSGGEP